MQCNNTEMWTCMLHMYIYIYECNCQPADGKQIGDNPVLFLRSKNTREKIRESPVLFLRSKNMREKIGESPVLFLRSKNTPEKIGESPVLFPRSRNNREKLARVLFCSFPKVQEYTRKNWRESCSVLFRSKNTREKMARVLSQKKRSAWKTMKGKARMALVSRPISAKTVQTSRSPLTASADRAIAIKRLAADMITDKGSCWWRARS